MKESETNPFEHLQKVLRNLEGWLEHGDKAHVMLAKPTLEEFLRQPLPSHLHTTVKPRTGPRVAVRSPRDGQVNRQTMARWPKDNLIESSLPTIMCVVNGAADLRIADYVVHCRVGDILLRPPALAGISGSQPHFETDRTGRSCDLLWIFPGRLNGQGLESYLCYSREDEHSHGSHLWFKSLFLSTLFQELYEELERGDSRQSIEKLFSTLIFTMQRQIARDEAIIPPFSPEMKTPILPSQEPIQLAQSYIEMHLGQPLTIELVARHVGLSASVFKRKFKQFTGQTFNSYVATARMKKAAELLHGSEMFISEVSHVVGMTDCHFRRLARQHWGCTPHEYRQNKSDRI